MIKPRGKNALIGLIRNKELLRYQADGRLQSEAGFLGHNTIRCFIVSIFYPAITCRHHETDP